MNLWNANCDAKVPKSKKELLRELDIWERTQGGLASTSQSGSNAVMRKDFDTAAWSASHDDDFKKLIESARKRSNAIGGRPANPQPPAGQQGGEESSLNASSEVSAAEAPSSEHKDEVTATEQSIPLPGEKLSQEAGPNDQESGQNQILDAPVA